MDNSEFDSASRVRSLSDYGLRMIEVDSKIPATRYVKSGKELIRMASVYEEEGDLEKAFILYNKFTTLFVEKLPKHPGYKSVPSEDRKNNRQLLDIVFPKAMAIKTKLLDKYEAEEKLRRAEQKRLDEISKKLLEQQRLEEEKKLQDEARRREEQQARMLMDTENQFRQMQLQEKSRLESERRPVSTGTTRNVTTITIGDNQHLPSSSSPTFPTSPAVAPSSQTDSRMPSAPFDDAPQLQPSVPPPPYSSVVYVAQKPDIPSRSLKPELNTSFFIPPVVDRSVKPSDIDHFTSVGESGLKPVHVPEDLVPMFLNRAMSNTARSVETCGILCGKLKSSQWYVTHLLIPQQSGTSDSCDIANEEALVGFQDEHDLVTLGWIHTHPTQTAFLSSVDQHTHWPYQKLLPEAIAIVVSPKFNETGYFYLTPDYGMGYIGNCNGKGFHEHPSHPPMFEKCPHVQIDQFSKVAITDLRINANR